MLAWSLEQLLAWSLAGAGPLPAAAACLELGRSNTLHRCPPTCPADPLQQLGAGSQAAAAILEMEQREANKEVRRVSAGTVLAVHAVHVLSPLLANWQRTWGSLVE